MNALPRTANDLLHAFGADSALIGDLEESARAGRSRSWCWLQVAGVVWLSSRRTMLTRPIYAARGIAIGWTTLLATFALVDAPMLTRLRLTGYQTGEWTAFWMAAIVLAYSGFALSAWAVARFQRQAPGLVVLHTATVLVGLTASALLTALHPGPTPVPHVLFPLVSVALPYQWRSGFVLVPAVMLLTGVLALRRRSLMARS